MSVTAAIKLIKSYYPDAKEDVILMIPEATYASRPNVITYKGEVYTTPYACAGNLWVYYQGTCLKVEE